ncbi:glycosyltransferase family 4 protein [Actinomycetes bacterium KLBMP 9797]
MKEYDLTVALTYYEPYVSGLTHTARVIAEGMAERGWRVAVVAARHDRSLPTRETIAGVDVYRCPVAGVITRAQVTPTYPLVTARLARRSGVLNLHLPMAEASLVARLAGRTPVVSTLHIDLYLPPGRLNRVAVAASDITSRSAIRRSAAVVANSEDQAHASKFWPLVRERNFRPIPAPCLDRRGGSARYRETPGLHVGFLGRIVEDKGIAYLVRAFRRFADPEARLLIGGNHRTVAGGSNLDDIRGEIASDPRIRVLGELRGAEIDDFYASIDVFALPSVAESFGIVQAEAMMCGIPSVTTDLPGGRYPVLATGFGELVPPRDVPALERALLRQAAIGPGPREASARDARQRFSVDTCLDAYEKTFVAARDAPAIRASLIQRWNRQG